MAYQVGVRAPGPNPAVSRAGLDRPPHKEEAVAAPQSSASLAWGHSLPPFLLPLLLDSLDHRGAFLSPGPPRLESSVVLDCCLFPARPNAWLGSPVYSAS